MVKVLSNVFKTQPPVYLDATASISQSLVSEGCKVYGKIENSVLFSGVKIGKGAMIKDSVILPNAIIEENAVVNRAVVGSNTRIRKNAMVGEAKAYSDIMLIGENQIVEQVEKIEERVI